MGRRTWERARTKRRFRPGRAEWLEPRELMTVVGLKVAVTPQLLAPSGRIVPVRVTGEATVSTPIRKPPLFTFQLVDDYRQTELRQPVPIRAVQVSPGHFNFAFTVPLRASVVSKDIPGRHYYMTIAATDDKNTASKDIPILVPSGPLNHPTPRARPAPVRPLAHPRAARR